MREGELESDLDSRFRMIETFAFNFTHERATTSTTAPQRPRNNVSQYYGSKLIIIIIIS